MLKSGVYRIDLGGDGWYYLGSAQDLEKRERQHCGDLKRGDHCNQIMQNVFNKHGAFEFTVLGRYPVDEILRHEQILLDAHCADTKCTNIALVAAGSPMAGRNHTDESRAKMSASTAGSRHTEEARANMSAAAVGKKKSPEHCAAMRAANLGREVAAGTRAKLSAAQTGKKMPPRTAEWRAKMSAAQVGRAKSPEHRAKLSAALKGRKMPPRTPEHCAALSATTTAYYARRRLAESAP